MTAMNNTPPKSQKENPQVPSIKGQVPVAAPPGVAPSTVLGANSITGEYPIFTYRNRTGNN